MDKVNINALISLLKEYHIQNKYADRKFYTRAYDILRVGLDGYIDGLIVIEPHQIKEPEYKKYTDGFQGMFAQALYDKVDKKLVINQRNTAYGKEMEIRSASYEGDNHVSFYNILILQTLLHEIEHIRQMKKEKEGQGLEADLLRLASTATKPQTTLSYDYSILERLAEIKSLQACSVLYSKADINDPAIHSYLAASLSDKYKKGYGYVTEEGYFATKDSGVFTSPTELYMRLRGCNMDEFNRINQTATWNERVMYGMPLTLEQYITMFGTDALENAHSL